MECTKQRFWALGQLFTVILSLFLVVQGHIAALVLLIPAVLADVFARLCRHDTATVIKVIMLIQVLAMWFIVSVQFMTDKSLQLAAAPLLIQDNIHNMKTDISVHPGEVFDTEREIMPLNSQTLPSQLSDGKISNLPYVPISSKTIILKVFGDLPAVDFPDLKYRGKNEIITKYSRLFGELPKTGFDSRYANPCWAGNIDGEFSCLPYAYILGMPKCGTSDLFERLKAHDSIRMPRRKEVRWFTRGEFSLNALGREGVFPLPYSDTAIDARTRSDRVGGQREVLLGSDSSIFTFTRAFSDASHAIQQHAEDKIITIDGGPHTFWWPTQSPDGTLMPEDIPPPQLIREIQPNAKFIITLCDPVKRLYSDYYFLGDDLRPVGRQGSDQKSARELHERAVYQVRSFKRCVNAQRAQLSGENFKEDLHDEIWFRASQICAHDRHSYAMGGWGRLSIGLYSLYLEKWLEHFSPDQFLIVRLEDYEVDSRAYMQDILTFLRIDEPKDWSAVLHSQHANENHGHREAMLPETDAVLREFYRPYNEYLVTYTGKKEFLWDDGKRPGSYQSGHRIEAGSQSDGVVHPKHFSSDIRDSASSHNPHNIHKEHYGGPVLSLADELLLKNQNQNQNLRGNSVSDKEFIKLLRPKSKSIDSLPKPDSDRFLEWIEQSILSRDKPPGDSLTAGRQLCAAAFALDLAALKYLLYEVGVPANQLNVEDASRNPLHCVAVVHTMADAHPKSHVFAILKGKESWLSKFVEGKLPKSAHSVLARDIIDALEDAIDKTTSWLIHFGADVNHKDNHGNTPLLIASVGGQLSMVKMLLAHGANPNTQNLDLRSPLHFAAAYGHAEVLSELVKAGGDLDIRDSYGTTAREIVSNPGAIFPGDALKFLNIVQRPPKKIERVIHPQLFPSTPKTGWVGGTGGWGTERLKGFENNLECDVDQYWADEVDGDFIFKNYVARGAPVLIRGLIKDWPVISDFTRENLSKEHGDLRVEVSDIPYARKFGGSQQVDMTLGEYIDEVIAHRMVGGSHPWYVFKGHPIPHVSDAEHSLVPYDHCPTPSIVQNALEKVSGRSMGEGKISRTTFVNAQWALGGEGTGAPVHYHNTAWNALVYGAKQWVIYPPHTTIMSNRQILDYFETDMVEFARRGVNGGQCVQLAGDVMIIPESWGHGVLNIEESIAIATELKAAHWRLRPGSNMLSKLPFDNRNL